MADHAEHAEPRGSDQSTYHRQHWYLRCKELSLWLTKRKVITCAALVQIKDWAG